MKYTPTFWLDTNYALGVGLPMDSRTVVGSVANLTTKDIWMKGDVCIAYNGMLVGVADNDNPQDSGLYYLFDPECKTPLQSPDVQDINNWIKICSVSALNEFTATIQSIQTDLTGVARDVETLTGKFNSLDSRVGEVESSIGTLPEGSNIATELDKINTRISEVEVFPDIISGGSALNTSEV